MTETPDISKQEPIYLYLWKSSKTALSELRSIRIKMSRSSLDLPSKALECSNLQKCLMHSYENDFDLRQNETACRTHFRT